MYFFSVIVHCLAGVWVFKNDESEEAKKPMAIEEDKGRETRSKLSPLVSSNYLSRSENAFCCLYERQREIVREREIRKGKK